MSTITLPCSNNLTQRIILRKCVADIKYTMKMVWHNLIMKDLNPAACLLRHFRSRLSESFCHVFTQGRRLYRGSTWTIAHKRTQYTLALNRRYRYKIDACRSIVMLLHAAQSVMFDRCFFHSNIFSIIIFLTLLRSPSLLFVPFVTLQCSALSSPLRPVHRTSVCRSFPSLFVPFIALQCGALSSLFVPFTALQCGAPLLCRIIWVCDSIPSWLSYPSV